ncbi:hypothetical protein AB0885_36075, partial [Streptomyces sp. NPDC005534]|uniref:hypothetical protein n=1 Tax=Streptomyces sp. NPDC005534 TaxID=3155714 RepID=UPI00345304A8
ALGENPTTKTADPLVDAYLWIRATALALRWADEDAQATAPDAAPEAVEGTSPTAATEPDAG